MYIIHNIKKFFRRVTRYVIFYTWVDRHCSHLKKISRIVQIGKYSALSASSSLRLWQAIQYSFSGWENYLIGLNFKDTYPSCKNLHTSCYKFVGTVSALNRRLRRILWKYRPNWDNSCDSSSENHWKMITPMTNFKFARLHFEYKSLIAINLIRRV